VTSCIVPDELSCIASWIRGSFLLLSCDLYIGTHFPYASPVTTDAATYTASNGATFEWKCNYDYYGADIRSTHGVSTLETCLDQCADEPECVKVTWVADPQICYLKRDRESRDAPAQGMWGGKRLFLLPPRRPYVEYLSVVRSRS
jgi:hypothetical protein